MEIYTINNEIKLLCATATSFPDGIMEAFDRLNTIAPDIKDRKFYGISHPGQDGKIIYRAAVEQCYDGEENNDGITTFIIKKGEYIGEKLLDWHKDPSSIGKMFQTLLTDSRIDPNGFCLEEYMNDKDVRCMVPLILK